jgi:hypothetical protein
MLMTMLLCFVCFALLSQRPLAMNATSAAGVGSMEARDLSALQHQINAAAAGAAAPAAADGHPPDGVAAAPVADGLGGAALGSVAATGGGSMAADGEGAVGMVLGGAAAGGGGAGGGMATPGGSMAVPGDGGSMVVGDNSTGNVNKKLFVKRSCTEAMLKVSLLATQNQRSSYTVTAVLQHGCMIACVLDCSYSCPLQFVATARR